MKPRKTLVDRVLNGVLAAACLSSLALFGVGATRTYAYFNRKLEPEIAIEMPAESVTEPRDKPVQNSLESTLIAETPSQIRELESASSISKLESTMGTNGANEDFTLIMEDSEPTIIPEINSLSSEGIEFIKRFEGFSPVEYLCPAGKKTIGYGHVVLDRESFGKITETQGAEILSKDVETTERVVREYVKVPLSVNQYDALCSFVYNLGEGNFRRSTLLKELNLRNYQKAADEFGRWVKANGKKLPGLERRRTEEKEMFLRNQACFL